MAESGDLSKRRSFSADDLYEGNHCFAVTAIDAGGSQSVLSEIACTESTNTGVNDRLGVSNVSANFFDGSNVEISWNSPTGIVEPGSIDNLAGYYLYQGSSSQLFRVADVSHDAGNTLQSTQRPVANANNSCFAVTAHDGGGNESPLSLVDCVSGNTAESAEDAGLIAAPTALSTSATGGSSNIVLGWLASGVAGTGAPDPQVNKYNVYQGNTSSLTKVAEVTENYAADPNRSVLVSGVGASNSCFALTAQSEDLSESPLSTVVCRDE